LKRAGRKKKSWFYWPPAGNEIKGIGKYPEYVGAGLFPATHLVYNLNWNRSDFSGVEIKSRLKAFLPR
jgi:hypothetical protein